MPNASEGAAGARPIPPDLAADHRTFEQAVRPWLESHGGVALLPESVLDALTRYGLLVHEYAARVSLVGRADRPVLFTRHVLDSLNLASCLASPPRLLLDVGSGAGFPGIPLAVVWPQTRVILLESRDRKAGFLEHAVRRLGLGNVRVVCDRLERVSEGRTIDPVDAVTIRAVGDLPHLLATLEPLAMPGAWWAYFLGAGAAERGAQPDLGRFGRDARVLAGAFGGWILHGSLGGEAQEAG
jgi:16S rRNA (guanine527-N7)-methyltransferase